MTITLVDNTPTTEETTSYTFQKKCFKMAGLVWVFYSNGTYFGYKTSKDNFGAFTSLFSCAYGFWVCLLYDPVNNILYYVRQAAASSRTVYYRWGTPNSDGTITWSIAESSLTVSTILASPLISAAGDLYLSKDASGNLYLTMSYMDYTTDLGSQYWLRVFKYSAGTWTELTGARISYGGYTPCGGVIPLTGSKLALVHGTVNGLTVLKVRTSGDGGSTWTDDISSVGKPYLRDGSWTSLGDTVYVVGSKNASTDWTPRLYKFTYGDSAWTEVDFPLSDCWSNYEQYAGIAIEDATGKLHVWLVIYNSANILHYYSTDGGATWTVQLWATNRTIYVRYITISPHDYGNLITFAWKENSTSPYYVWMDSYSTAPPPVGVPRYIGDGLAGAVVIV
jgi:hypothetical protein